MTGYTDSSIDHRNITVVEQLLDVPSAGDRPAMVGYGRLPKPFL